MMITELAYVNSHILRFFVPGAIQSRIHTFF